LKTSASETVMEVHVRHVPQQATENGFKNFMKPHFAKLGIRAVNCQKARDKPFASLTFLHLNDAQRFLAAHGQARLPPGEQIMIEYKRALLTFTTGTRHRRQPSKTATNLNFRGQTIYCERSNRDPNPYLLRTLEKEQKDRHAKSVVAASAVETPDVLPIEFECSSVSCGVWSYSDSDLVFAPQQEVRMVDLHRFPPPVLEVAFTVTVHSSNIICCLPSQIQKLK